MIENRKFFIAAGNGELIEWPFWHPSRDELDEVIQELGRGLEENNDMIEQTRRADLTQLALEGFFNAPIFD